MGVLVSVLFLDLGGVTWLHSKFVTIYQAVHTQFVHFSESRLYF